STALVPSSRTPASTRRSARRSAARPSSRPRAASRAGSPRTATSGGRARGAASERADVAVVDCLTLWIANLVMRGCDSAAVAARCDELGALLDDPPCHVVLVTNEVGFGIVPDHPLGRAFRDAVGLAHQ